MRIISLLLWAVALVTCTVQPDQLPSDALKSADSFQYETEVAKLMNIIIHSLYKSKEIFLRELVSNAAGLTLLITDALDKIRFLSLTNKKVLDSNPDLKIEISADPEKMTLTIRDTGIGMTKESLRAHLGTIAKSGTGEFAAALRGNQSDLIGQFGVGFYSSFLVAETVRVISKNNDDEQHIWESTSANGYKIIKDPRGNTLRRGTEIILFLRPESKEFLEEKTLRKLIAKYSEFVNFPIYLLVTKEEAKVEQIPEADDKDDNNPEEVEDVLDDVDAPKKMVKEFELLNTNKPIWTRSPSDVSEEEYFEFYKGLFKEMKNPLAFSHFKAEGDTEFRSIMFIPEKPPKGLYDGGNADTAKENAKNVKMFVKRVFITDQLPNFLPKWLQFMKVMIDSDDLPLSVSRDTLQNHPKIRIIRKRIIGKGLDLISTLQDKPASDTDSSLYETFYKEFKSAIKFGLHDSYIPNKKLVELMRWDSSTHNFTSLSAYVERMKNKQPQIYYVICNSRQEGLSSPIIENLVARGYEVLFFLDPIDDYLANDKMSKFESFPLQNVGKNGVKFGDEEDNESKEEELKEKFKPLTDYLQDVLSEECEEVAVSTLLTSSACAVIPTKTGLSAASEKMMVIQAQGRNDYMSTFYRSQKRILQINPHHPLVLAMLKKVQESKQDDIELLVPILFETYAIGSGYDTRQPADFVKSVEALARKELGVAADAKAKVDVKVAENRKVTSKKEAEPVETEDAEEAKVIEEEFEKYEL